MHYQKLFVHWMIYFALVISSIDGHLPTRVGSVPSMHACKTSGRVLCGVPLMLSAPSVPFILHGSGVISLLLFLFFFSLVLFLIFFCQNMLHWCFGWLPVLSLFCGPVFFSSDSSLLGLWLYHFGWKSGIRRWKEISLRSDIWEAVWSIVRVKLFPCPFVAIFSFKSHPFFSISLLWPI